MSRGTWVPLVLFLHVTGAIAGVGPSLTYGMWTSVAERGEVGPEASVLAMIRRIDRHLATPALLSQAATGGVLVWLEGLRFWRTAWLVSGVAVYVLVMVVAVALVGPWSRRRLALAERGGRGGPPEVAGAYEAMSRRLRPLIGAVALLTLVILYLMIAKPALWSAG